MSQFKDFLPADSKDTLKGGFKDYIPEKKEEKPKVQYDIHGKEIKVITENKA